MQSIELHPEFLKKDGKPQFAVISYEEFLTVKEVLEDYQDLQLLRQAKQERANDPLISFEDMRKEFNLTR